MERKEQTSDQSDFKADGKERVERARSTDVNLADSKDKLCADGTTFLHVADESSQRSKS